MYQGCKKTKCAVTMKILGFYTKRLFYAIIISMYDTLGGRLQMTLIFLIHAVFLINEYGFFLRLYADNSMRFTTIIMESQIMGQIVLLTISNSQYEPSDLLGYFGVMFFFIPSCLLTVIGLIKAGFSFRTRVNQKRKIWVET
jgi:hypothetical protein